MRTINFGGFTYYYAYQIYVTEPCLIRKTNGIYPGCTRAVSVAATPIKDTGTYFSAKDAKAALQKLRSIIREEEVNAPRGFAYVIEYYAQLLIVDENCKPYNKEEERIYAQMEENNIRQKKPPGKSTSTKKRSSRT